MWHVQTLPKTDGNANGPEEAAAYEALKDMTRRCLCADPQKRVKAAHMATVLCVAADKAGWV